MGQKIVDQICEVLPQIRDHLDYVEVSSPLTLKHYLNREFGEMLGLDHSLERFAPDAAVKLRHGLN